MCRLWLLFMFAGSIFCQPYDRDYWFSIPPNLTDANGWLTCMFEPMYMIVGQEGLAPPYRLFPLIPALVSGEDEKSWFLMRLQKLWTVLENNLYLKLIPVREGMGCQLSATNDIDPFSALFAQVLDWFKNPNCLNNAKMDSIQLEAEQAVGLVPIEGTLVAVPLPIGGRATAQIIGVAHSRVQFIGNEYSDVRQWTDRYAQTLFPSVNATQA